MKSKHTFLNFILSFIIFFALFFDILTIGLSLGVFKEENLYTALEKGGIYEMVYDELFTSSSLSEQEKSYLQKALPLDSVKTTVNNIIHYVFTSEKGDFDLTNEVNDFLTNYANDITNNVNIYVNDYFDALKKNNYVFNNNIILNTTEETFCHTNLNFDLNDYIREIYNACNNDATIFATVADTIKEEALTSMTSTINQELLTSKEELNKYINSSFYTDFLEDDNSSEFSTLRDLTKVILTFNNNVTLIRGILTLIIILCVLIMYLLYRPTYTHLIFRNFGGILIFQTIIFSLLIKFANILKQSLLEEVSGSPYIFTDTLANSYIKPFTFLTVCMAIIMVFCFILYYILLKANTNYKKKNI